MKGMVLAAGLGERLRPLTEKTPKPLLEIGGTTMIRNAIAFLRTHGIRDIAVNIHHLGHLVRRHLESDIPEDISLHFSEEPVLLGTAGGIKAAEPFLKDSPFVVVNADVLSDFDLPLALAAHRRHNALATLVLRDNPDPQTIGALEMSADQRLTRFLGSFAPGYRPAADGGGLMMFTGIHVFSPGIFGYIPAGRPVNISTEIYPLLLESGAALGAVRHGGYWADIGTHETYRNAKDDVARGLFTPYGMGT